MKHPELIRIIGFAMLVAGFTVNYIIAKRRFNRHSITGLEEFKSFENALLTRLVEKIGSLFAKLFVFFGVILFLFSLA